MQLTNRINFRNLQGDLFGGVTTAIVSLPMALAFGVVSGAGPVAGLFQGLFGVFRFGKYITLMPDSVISGFMSGIGVTLVILQIASFLGQKASRGGVLGTVTNHLSQA